MFLRFGSVHNLVIFQLTWKKSTTLPPLAKCGRLFLPNRISAHLGHSFSRLASPPLLSKQDYLSQWIDEMRRVMALAQTEIEKLRQENKNLKEESQRLRYQQTP